MRRLLDLIRQGWEYAIGGHGPRWEEEYRPRSW
jgi:hypothetical protein